MLETRYGHLSMSPKQAAATIYGGFLDKITGLGGDRAAEVNIVRYQPSNHPTMNGRAWNSCGGWRR